MTTGTTIIILLLVIGFAQGSFKFKGAGMDIFRKYLPGWEIIADPYALRNDQYQTVLSKPADGVGPVQMSHYRAIDNDESVEWDEPEYGLPNIVVEMTSVRQANTWPYEQLIREYENWKYTINRVDYEFEVQIITKAGAVMHSDYDWWHETSMPFGWMMSFGQTGGTHFGKNFDGYVYVRFGCLPWQPYQIDPVANYTFKEYWFGVMDALITKVDVGYADPRADDVDIQYKGWERPASVNAHPGMYFEDEDILNIEPYPSVDWDETKILDARHSSVVLLKFPFDLLAGAHTRWEGPINAHLAEVKPMDVFIKYTVKVEGFIVKEYLANDPVVPTIVDNPPLSNPGYNVPFSTGFDWSLIIWILIGLAILLVLFVVFVPVGALFLGTITGGLIRLCKKNEGVKWQRTKLSY